MNAPVLLSPEHIAMVDRGVSVIVASRDAALRPSIMRGVGSAISADGTQVTVFLRRSQSRQLMQDIEAGGGLAVVFSEPPTHRTLQLKARQASLRPASPTDQPQLARYLASMQCELAQVGYGPEFAAAMLSAPLEDVVAVQFTPESAFDQTPGPRAGIPLDVPKATP
ncbi:MAG: hypothetical protein KDE65_10850 [Burkholderiaceae bacterium]|jgi:hypothetical protein|nr:hypothetical protein [Burkholderiaceae bacterium]MCB1988633.1 hypothetical protein [Burkholderiaceae bacterium]